MACNDSLINSKTRIMRHQTLDDFTCDSKQRLSRTRKDGAVIGYDQSPFIIVEKSLSVFPALLNKGSKQR